MDMIGIKCNFKGKYSKVTILIAVCFVAEENLQHLLEYPI